MHVSLQLQQRTGRVPPRHCLQSLMRGRQQRRLSQLHQRWVCQAIPASHSHRLPPRPLHRCLLLLLWVLQACHALLEPGLQCAAVSTCGVVVGTHAIAVVTRTHCTPHRRTWLSRPSKLTSDVAALHWMTWAQTCSTPPAHWQRPLGVFVKTWQACHVKTTA